MKKKIITFINVCYNYVSNHQVLTYTHTHTRTKIVKINFTKNQTIIQHSFAATRSGKLAT